MVQYKDIGLNYLLKQVLVLLNSTTDLEVQIDKFAVKTTWLGWVKFWKIRFLLTAELLSGVAPTIFSQPFDELIVTCHMVTGWSKGMANCHF